LDGSLLEKELEQRPPVLGLQERIIRDGSFSDAEEWIEYRHTLRTHDQGPPPNPRPSASSSLSHKMGGGHRKRERIEEGS